jgi:tetratricopeptide (TPR) repeat protein
MPEPVNQHPDNLATDQAAPPAHGGLSRWIVVAAALALVIGPLLGGGLQEERARWRVAAAIEHWLDDDLDAALKELNAAADLAPDDARTFALRSQLKVFLKDYGGALQDAERHLELDSSSDIGVHLKTNALMYLDRKAEAVQAFAEYAAIDDQRLQNVSPDLLNGLAYYRALANQDLEKALAEVETAIDLLSRTTAWERFQAATLDTRGYIRFLQKKYKAAQSDMDAAVIAAERDRNIARTESHKATKLSVADPRVAAWELRVAIDRNVAVIRYHRALLMEKLGRTEDVQRDYRRIRELGFEPGPTLF